MKFHLFGKLMELNLIELLKYHLFINNVFQLDLVLIFSTFLILFFKNLSKKNPVNYTINIVGIVLIKNQILMIEEVMHNTLVITSLINFQ